MNWLYKEDHYEPLEDKEAFVDKSLLAMVGVLSKIQRNSRSRRSGALYNLNPVLKLAAVVLVVLLLALSRNIYFVFLTGGLVLLAVALLDVEDMKRVLYLCLFVPLFTLVALLPSMMAGNMYNGLLIVLKVLTSVTAVNMLSFSSKWHDMTKALKLFLIPDIFILVIDTTLKYIYLLGEMSYEMLTALKLRSLGKNNDKYMSISKIMGNLFIKSTEMSGEMFAAMECRGYTGEYQTGFRFRLTWPDIFFILIMIGLIFLFLIF